MADKHAKLKKETAERTAKQLVGRKIVGVRYMTDQEAKYSEWSQAAVILELDDGGMILPQSDDEGNGPGSLLYLPPGDELITIPVI